MNTLSATKNPAIAYTNTSPIIPYHGNPIPYIHSRGDAPVLAPCSPLLPRFRGLPTIPKYSDNFPFQYNDKIVIAPLSPYSHKRIFVIKMSVMKLGIVRS